MRGGSPAGLAAGFSVLIVTLSSVQLAYVAEIVTSTCPGPGFSVTLTTFRGNTPTIRVCLTPTGTGAPAKAARN